MGLFSTEEHRCHATVETAEQSPVEGLVVDNDETSVLVEFPRHASPLLPIAEEVRLKLTANEPSVSSILSARVVHCASRAEYVRYRFRLPVKDAPDLVRLFRRRNAYRAKPNPRDPISVLVETPSGVRSKAELFDISVTGMSLVVDADEEGSLFRSEPLKLVLRLPDQTQLFELYARIRTRALVGSAIRYGLEFDPEATPRPVLQFERIMRYVMDRQLDIIRAKRDVG